MSRPPPSSAYPAVPRGGTQIPPFPQLLHLKDNSYPPPQQAGQNSVPQWTPDPQSGRPALTLTPDQVDLPSDEEEDVDSHASPGHTGTAKDGPTSGKKERKPHATRRRVVQSCSECRRRKIKCDKKFPCGPCILRSDQARCHEVGMAEKNVVSNTSNYASTSDLALLAHRLDALESSLIKSGALLPSDLEYYLKSTRASIANIPNTIHQSTTEQAHPPANDRPVPLGEEETVDDTEGAALTLEHLAFGRSRVEGSHSLPHFGARYPSTVGRSVPNNSYHLAKSSTIHTPLGMDISPGHDITLRKPSLGYGKSPLSQEERNKQIDTILDLMGPTDVFDLFYRKTDVVMRALTKVLPSRERGELLVKAYLEKVDWLHRCMHIPSFLQSCNDLWSLPVESVVHEISMPFLGLYLTVCTLGMQFMDAAEVAKHFSLEEAHTLPDLWYNSARSALWSADFMAAHTTEALQCLLLMMVFMNNRDRADAAWALLGASIKMAQGLGLSRLGAEQQAADGKPLPMWTGRWESLIQREVGRRIWWNLVFLDWALAPSYNFTCSIQPDQIKTALPANIEDEDLVDDQPLRPQPVHVRTGMSFQLARLKFAEISHRQIWQANNNSHPPYSFILSVDGELRKAMMELPAFFQPDSNTRGPPNEDPKALVHYYEKIMLNLAIHSRMLRLHRPWLSRGYEDERFAYSKEQCIRAARASLRMMGDTNGCASFLEKWWIPLFYVSVSGLVVIIDLLRTARRHMRSTETEHKILEVKGALDQMRRIADISHPSRAAVKVMDFLMAEVEERRKPGSTLGKRKAEGSPPGDDEEQSDLQRAVKKLIRQAQLEADSPNLSMGSGNTPTPGASGGGNGWSPNPKTGREIDMRIFSDTPRDRPVFDAYPMPPPQIQDAYNAMNASNNNNNGGNNGAFQIPNQAQPNGNSPMNFSLDPTNSTFAQFDPRLFAPTQTPQLDPAVESILTSYFPQPQTSSNTQVGSAAVPQVPDDFLSKVFNFGWDTAPTQQNNNNMNGNGTNNGGNANGQGPGNAMANIGNIGDSVGLGQQGLAGYNRWGAGGWMA